MYLSPCAFRETVSFMLDFSFDLVVTVFFGSSLNSTHSVELNYSFPVHRILYSVEVIGLTSSWHSVKRGPGESLWRRQRRPTKVYRRLSVALACGESSLGSLSLFSLSLKMRTRLTFPSLQP